MHVRTSSSKNQLFELQEFYQEVLKITNMENIYAI